MSIIQHVKNLIEQNLNVLKIEITDESDDHIGHPGHKENAQHLNLMIVSDDFIGKSLLQRHQMIYAIIGELIPTRIHAVKISALTEEEV